MSAGKKTPLSNKEIQEKILSYETFINDVLKEDLKEVHDQWDKTTGEIAEWEELKNVLNTLNEIELIGSFKTQMNIGTNIYVQVNVPDASKILINLGCGIYLEYKIDEALRYIEKRIKILIQQSNVLKSNSAKIKARIKLVLNGIQELSKIK